MPIRAVVDTNVIYAGLYSNAGASHLLLRFLRARRWTLVLSNTVCAEYEEILKRQAPILGLSLEEIDRFLNGLCLLAERRTLATTWTPILHDPDDEALAHLAVEAQADYLVTYNVRHVAPVAALGVEVITPKEFLSFLRGQS
jgi:putative PIN family toxin of toxin-antitoxin system